MKPPPLTALALTAVVALAAGGAATSCWLFLHQAAPPESGPAPAASAEANSAALVHTAQDETTGEPDPLASDSSGSSAARPEAASTAAAETTEGVSDPGLATATLLQRADDLIAEGGFAAAVRLLRTLQTNLPSELQAPIAFRLGVCSEALGEWTDAMRHYDTAAGLQPQTALGQQALFGKVRCWNGSGRRELAWGALYQLALQPGATSAAVAGDAWHLLGNALTGAASLPVADPQSLDDSQLFGTVPQVAAADVLAAARIETEPDTRDAGRAREMIRVTQRFGTGAEDVFLSVRARREPVARLLVRLAAAAGWSLEAAPDLGAALGSRTESWDIEEVDAACWLDAVLSGHDARWILEGDRLLILPLAEAAEAERRDYRRGQTRRALQQALTRAPEHRWACHSYLALGRLAAAEGRLAEALRFHEQGLAPEHSVECEIELLLNAARLQLALGDREAGLRSLYRAVDSHSMHPLQPLGYLSIGRLQLENGSPQRAIPELMRALSLSEQTPLESVAACLLASAYLLKDNPHGANAVLMKRSRTLSQGPLRDQAALLSSLARLQAARDPDERMRAAASVMEAVAHVDPAAQTGGHWWVLIVRAMEATGLSHEASRVRRECLARTQHFPLRDELLLRSVREELDCRAPSDTDHVFALLEQRPDLQIKHEVQLLDAQTAFRQGRDEAALQRCLELAQETAAPEAVRREALRLMGRIYQQRDDFQSAVVCFAGALPPAAQKAAATSPPRGEGP